MGLVGELMDLPGQLTDALLVPVLAELKALQGIACLPLPSSWIRCWASTSTWSPCPSAPILMGGCKGVLRTLFSA
jgi:hypothetical protein